jgi:peptidoglycan/xylan/chitin deacetylase (PgdA/CDA1 family)
MVARTVAMMRPEDRDVLARRFREILGTPPRDPGLSEADVKALVEGGFEIGFHTAGHYWLQVLDDHTLHDQMQGADRLSVIAGRRLTTIAYPYGPGDLRIASAAADAGYELGVVWSNAAVSADSHPLLLDRVDGAWPSAAEFAFRMARFVAASG